MVTDVKAASGDRASKAPAVLAALDAAFADRISRCFDSMCDTFEDEQATALFMQRFKQATDAWNVAKAAVELEYPV
jgi:hypothetical protein